MQRYKDKLLRKHFKLNEHLIITLKFILNNPLLFNNKNFINNIYNQNYFIYKFLTKNSLYKIKNYCIKTNRSKGIVNNLKISRILLKKYASKGFINGFYKSSW